MHLKLLSLAGKGVFQLLFPRLSGTLMTQCVLQVSGLHQEAQTCEKKHKPRLPDSQCLPIHQQVRSLVLKTAKSISIHHCYLSQAKRSF